MPDPAAHASLLVAALALLATVGARRLLLKSVGLLLLAGGWLLGFLHNCQIFPDQGLGCLGCSLAGSAAAMLPLLPLNGKKQISQPPVILAMGTGAVLGAFFGFPDGSLLALAGAALPLAVGVAVRRGASRWPTEEEWTRLIAVSFLAVMAARVAANSLGYSWADCAC